MNNMKIFKFYDTDITGTQEYDICDKDYVLLIDVCCKYSVEVYITILCK